MAGKVSPDIENMGTATLVSQLMICFQHKVAHTG
jgi:hypothetical protein